MKKYNVIWEERHSVVVEANNEEEAVEKVMEGNYGSDDSAEISTPPEAYEIKEKIKTITVSVSWKTHGKDVGLPKEVEIPAYLIEEDYNVADYLSDKYGWLVNGWARIDK